MITSIQNHPDLWRARLPRLAADTHKYKRGHLLLLAGDRMPGAVLLAARAAMRMGAGLCTILGPEKWQLLCTADAPHILYNASVHDAAALNILLENKKINAFHAGSGWDVDDAVGKGALVDALLAAALPGVLDAGALRPSCPPATVQTPHDGEFARLFPDLAGLDRVERAATAAKSAGGIMVLKGPETVIAGAGRVPVVNTHAAPTLATAGSGDVLAGMIGGLIAQGMDSFDSACAAVWIHGEAALRFGPGLVAPDIIEAIPGILRDFA